MKTRKANNLLFGVLFFASFAFFPAPLLIAVVWLCHGESVKRHNKKATAWAQTDELRQIKELLAKQAK